jgi:hypothetical protein
MAKAFRAFSGLQRRIVGLGHPDDCLGIVGEIDTHLPPSAPTLSSIPDAKF